MAASAFIAFDKYPLNTMNNNINMADATAGRFKCILATADWTPDVTEEEYNPASGIGLCELPTANGYTVGGVALTGISLTELAGVTKWISDTISWLANGGSIVARYAAIYETNNNKFVCYCQPESGANKTATDGNYFSILPDAAGILFVTKAA